MGVSQSRNEENVAAGRPKSTSINQNFNYSETINTAANQLSERTPPSSSMSSNNRRLRMIIPKRKSNASTKKSDNACLTNETSSTTTTSTTAPSPIVASFMTNISSNRYNNVQPALNADFINKSTYPYPRAHSTNLMPLGNNSVPVSTSTSSSTAAASTNSSATTSGLRWPASIRKQAARERMAAALDIPSPVPSVSEPSEDNISIESEMASTDLFESDLKTKQQSAIQSNIGFIDERHQQQPQMAKLANTQNEIITTIQPTKTDSIMKNSIIRLDKEMTTPSVFVSGIPKRKEENLSSTNIIRSKSMMEKNSGDITCTQSMAATQEDHVKRPNTLLATSTFGKSRSAWAKLCVGIAPLAESESFVIENSPAVEFPPSHRYGQSKIQPPSPLSSSIDSEEKDSGYVPGSDFDEKGKRDTVTTTSVSRMQSRLKNPTTYANRQRQIYNRHAVPISISNRMTSSNGQKDDESMEEKNGNNEESKKIDLNSKRPLTINTNIIPDSDLNLSSSITSTYSPNMVNLKRELHDSGVRMDSLSGGGHSTSEATTIAMFGGRSGSPEESLYRGLIDDEIRDQPDLMIGGEHTEAVDHGRSRASTFKEDNPDLDTIVENLGPVRLRDKIVRRRSNRMNESYESTVSSLSIDSEDMMLDFDGSDLMGEDTHGDNVSNYSSLGRRSSRHNSGGGTGSWGRRKVKNLAASGKRPSMEAVMDEWTSLKDEVEKGPQNETQRQYALSDLPPPSCSQMNGGRILKPPVTLECSGLPSIGLEQQTYRHVVQDVTVMKTLLLRLKRVLQDSETSNPFEISMNAMNGLSKLLESDMQKTDGDKSQLSNEALKEENNLLRSQMALMIQQVEDQNRIIQCLQYRLKQCRQRSVRKSETNANSVDEENLPGEISGITKYGTGKVDEKPLKYGSTKVVR